MRKLRRPGANVVCDFSIREFCELDTPIFMFDKDGAFIVLKLEQVGNTPSSNPPCINSC